MGLGGQRRLAGVCAIGGRGDRGAGSIEDVEAEVAAAFDPFVVLFSKHGSDEADDGRTVGEDADDVGAPSDFFVESFLGLLDNFGARSVWGGTRRRCRNPADWR
jgi:hypothetical protein